MDKYKCSICGHVYDPDKGEPGYGTAAGIGFEKLPASWTCPICGAEKTLFDKV
jgi:rubredoxin